MTATFVYEVIKPFHPSMCEEINSKKLIKYLSELKEGERKTPQEFIQQNLSSYELNIKSKQTIASMIFRTALRLGIVRKVNLHPITFEDFCKLESIQYFKEQIRGSHLKNILGSKLSSTQKDYLYKTYAFNNWLHGREFEYTKKTQIDSETWKQSRDKVILEGLEQLLKLYKQSPSNDPDFIKIIKLYLMSTQEHGGKSPSSVDGIKFAILGYFDKNDYPISINFKAKSKYAPPDLQKNLSLVDLTKILLAAKFSGEDNLVKYAAILCKFQRGLDNVTLCDRFNFETWPQICTFFGTENYEKWDSKKCPVPIKLRRVKTNYLHIGFLDFDAIEGLKQYLEFREKKTFSPMQDGEPLFINRSCHPIQPQWIWKSIAEFAKKAGIQNCDLNGRIPRYEKDSHELRDLLKSTLIDCGTRSDAADHFIGHSPSDSYEKQAMLYQDSLRIEYMKASSKINIISSYFRSIEKAEASNNNPYLHAEKLI